MITNTSNTTIKTIRALAQRKKRAETGQFFIEGIRIVGEAVEMGAEIDTLVVAPEILTSDYGRDVRRSANARQVIEVSREVFEAISAKDGPQGLAAVVRQRWTALDQIRPGEGLCWVALDAPQDPGNIGTIIRTCDAVGAAGVILLDNAADPYDPGAVRASMGALFTVSVARADSATFNPWRRRAGFALVGTSDRATTHYRAQAYTAPLILLMGSERQGLSGAQQAECDAMVSLPMMGRADSLNLAVATGVMLYEILHQRAGITRR